MKFIYILIFAILAGVAIWFFRGLSRGELADKPVYASLQAAELQFRGKPGPGLIYDETGGHLLAGFSVGPKKRVWVALDSRKHNGDLLTVPEHGEANIPCGLVDQLASSNIGDSDVKTALAVSCIK
ncbi:hypothetical protein [Stenotrophomonas maltophilia]|uniref:hypothetical protein n=2 Tax=Stenotrophomonas maltophilia TaxID=40324 RepID=UPI00128E9210|nr:hypothetical protein [Stenotrophomonas maltophilia]